MAMVNVVTVAAGGSICWGWSAWSKHWLSPGNALQINRVKSRNGTCYDGSTINTDIIITGIF